MRVDVEDEACRSLKRRGIARNWLPANLHFVPVGGGCPMSAFGGTAAISSDAAMSASDPQLTLHPNSGVSEVF